MESTVLIGLKPLLPAEPLLKLVRRLVPAPATVHLASVVNVTTDGDETERLQQEEERLAKLCASLTEDGYSCERHVNIGPMMAGSRLAGLASDIEADLLVIGLAKRSRVGKALLGSDAQTVLLQTPCPVVCMHLEDEPPTTRNQRSRR
jgi:nucleotide-binding universal stress UspA family protein